MKKIRNTDENRGDRERRVSPDGNALEVGKKAKGSNVSSHHVLNRMIRIAPNVIAFVPHLLIKRAQARNLIAKQSREAGRPSVGIFWALPGNDVIAHQTALDTAVEYGGYLTSPSTHYETWSALQKVAQDNPNVRDYEYEFWPRGRINYNKDERTFYLYADRKILENAAVLNKIKKEFGLFGANVKMGTDPHYQSDGEIGGVRKIPMQVILTLRTTYDDGETHDKEFAGMIELRKYLAKFYHVDADEWNAIRDELAEGQEVELSGDRLQIIKQEKRQMPMTGRTVLPEVG